MSALDTAIPLAEENPNWKEVNLEFKCGCGYRGHVSELLCVEDNDTMWCPVCLTAGWVWV